MLAHDAELNAGFARKSNHLPSRIEVDCHRLLHEDMFAKPRAEFNGGEPIGREGAYIDIINVRVRTNVLRGRYKFCSAGFGEGSAARFSPVCTEQDLIANVAISLCVLACDGSCADDSHSHGLRDSLCEPAAVDHTKHARGRTRE